MSIASLLLADERNEAREELFTISSLFDIPVYSQACVVGTNIRSSGQRPFDYRAGRDNGT